MSDRPFHNLERSSLFDAALARIEQAVREGRFGPGDQLPSERHLSIDLGISRPVVREVLGVLSDRGWVRKEQGRGVFVTDLVAKRMLADPVKWIMENRSLIEKYYESRLAVEPTCAALASERASDAQIEALRSLTETADSASESGDVTGFVALDIDFHAAIARMAANPFLERMLNAVIRPELDIRTLLHHIPGHQAVSQKRHRRVLSAIEARDPQGAEQAMREALTKPAEDIQILITKQEEES